MIFSVLVESNSTISWTVAISVSSAEPHCRTFYTWWFLSMHFKCCRNYSWQITNESCTSVQCKLQLTRSTKENKNQNLII